MSETNKVSYTPGPWKYDPYWSLIHGPKGVEIAAIHAAMQQGEKRARLDTARANARLIAAAPGLLEALRECLHQLHGLTDMMESCDVSERETDAIKMAERAIRKATK